MSGKRIRWSASSRVFVFAILFHLVVGAILAQVPPAIVPASAAAGSEPRVSVTESSITVGRSVLKYEATSGLQQLKDDADNILAEMFFVAYTEQGVQDESKRPITLAFNGGPGASSVLLHLAAVGPKRVPLADDGKLVPSSPQWVDNEDTWLRFTDLVLIDTVGTGFSRPAPDVAATKFYGVDGDAWSFMEFIRLYVSSNHRWSSPKFIAGESYGGTRAVILARLLQTKLKMNLNGLILISPVIDFKTLNPPGRTPSERTTLAYALDVPSYAATARYYGRLSSKFQADFLGLLRDAEQWSMNEYLPALVEGDTLPEEAQARIARALSSYTGISESFIRLNHLRLPPYDFTRELLRDRHLWISRLDGRIAFDPSTAREYTTGALIVPLGLVFDDYVRNELKYATDQTYEALSRKVEEAWDWGPGGPTGFLNVIDDLNQALQGDTSMRVLVASGYYDLNVPYFGTDYALNQLRLPPTLRANLIRTYYESGHMVYTSRAMLAKLTADVSNFVESGPTLNPSP